MRLRCLALAVMLQPAVANAETLVVALSTERIGITSNFTGADLALFGSIERDANTIARAGNYDIVVTVLGPRGSVVVREKKNWGPLWLNLDQRKYIAIPAFIAVLSNRTLETIASPQTRAKLHIGIETLVPPQGDKNRVYDGDEPNFRDALIRLRRSQKLFDDNGKAVSFFGSNLFRANIRIPGTVPLGRYSVEVALFADGSRLTSNATAFNVIKRGVEQQFTKASRDYGLAYGLATSVIALFVGWLASVIFRRD